MLQKASLFFSILEIVRNLWPVVTDHLVLVQLQRDLGLCFCYLEGVGLPQVKVLLTSEGRAEHTCERWTSTTSTVMQMLY